MSEQSLKYYINSFFSWYRVGIIITLIILTSYWYFYPIALDEGWCNDVCSYEVSKGFLEPLYDISHVLIATLLTLVVSRTIYIRRWLYYVASWLLPIAIIFIFSQPIASGGFLPMPERAIAFALSSFAFLLITVLSIVIFILYDFWQLYRARKSC